MDTMTTPRSHFDADTMIHKARAMRAIEEHGNKAFDTPEGVLMVSREVGYVVTGPDMEARQRGDDIMECYEVFPVDCLGYVSRIDVRHALGY